MSAPAPLTPPDSDLRDFPFMPLHVARLRDSGMAAEGTPEGCWYAVLLWAAAWHQLPAGSLPDNDAALMRLAGLGRDARTWRRHREAALRGFRLCSDGRLYHPVIAEQVASAWQAKRTQRWRSEVARIRKHNQRHGTRIPAPTLKAFVAGGARPMPLDGIDPPPAADEACPAGQPLQETGTGTGTGTGRFAAGDDAGADAIALAAELCRIGGVRHVEPAAILRAQAVVRQWLAEGFDPAAEIIPAIRGAVAARSAERISSLAYFDGPLRQFRARKEARDHGHAPAPSAAAPALRGPRPDPALDMWRDAQRRLAGEPGGFAEPGAAADPGADLGTGAALPPYLADRHRGA